MTLVGAACALGACGDACLEPGCECECHQVGRNYVCMACRAALHERCDDLACWCNASDHDLSAAKRKD